MMIKNRLLNYNDLIIYQNKDWFNFSIDSVLLPNFVTLNKKTKKILDLCTGNAPIPLILSTKTNADIIGVELQKEIAILANKSVNDNNLQNRITILNNNVLDIVNMFKSDTFDVITCNPPYFKCSENSKYNINMIKTIARHEIEIELEDIFKISKKLLKNNGILSLVHRTDRLVDIIAFMRKYKIEPKRLRFCYPCINKESNIILIEGSKNGKSGMKICPPLYIHEASGEYSNEVKEMFQ